MRKGLKCLRSVEDDPVIVKNLCLAPGREKPSIAAVLEAGGNASRLTLFPCCVISFERSEKEIFHGHFQKNPRFFRAVFLDQEDVRGRHQAQG
jgi:hypothetical protein